MFNIKALRIQKDEAGVSRHLPYAYFASPYIIRTKQGDYLTVLKIKGIPTSTLEDNQLSLQQTLRSKLFAAFCDPRFAIYHNIIRNQARAIASDNIDIPVIKELIDDYYQTLLKENRLFTNDLYLTIILKGSGSQGNRITSRANQWLENLSHRVSKKRAVLLEQDAIKLLDEAVLRFITSLQQYQVERLSLTETNQGLFAEPLRFFSQILNNDDSPYLATSSDLSVYLPKRHLFFGAKSIEARGNSNDENYYAAMISLKEYPASTYPGMLDQLLELPVEMVITQSYAFQNRQDTRASLELQLRRLRQARDPDKKGIELLETALGELVAGEFGFGNHHFTVMIKAKNLDLLEKQVAEVIKYCSDCGIVAIREHLNCEAAFWAQFPGNFRYIVRKIPITTENFAAFCSLHNESVGNKTGNHWGNAVVLLKTPQHQPYYFNFHPTRSDVGHTLITGATGSGKTLLTCFLIANALKYQSRVFYFDKDRGAEAFMRAIGGAHATLGNGIATGFNPLQLSDTRRNRRFLVDWLQSLLTAFGETLSSSDIEIIHHAVRLNYEQLKPEERTLINLAEAFGHSGPGTLRERLMQWCEGGAYGEFFGNTQDTLQLTNRFFCFEMHYLLEQANERVRPSVLLYIFHRIQLALDENTHHVPTIICLDEAWALLDNPIFAQSIRNWLKTFRKRNAIVILLSQEITDISNSSISNSIIAETTTKIFFSDPNPLRSTYQNLFHLTEREINLLQTYSSHLQRCFLIKQPQESLWTELDVTPIAKWIPLLSGNSRTVQHLHQLMHEYGTHPQIWLPAYLQPDIGKKVTV